MIRQKSSPHCLSGRSRKGRCSISVKLRSSSIKFMKKQRVRDIKLVRSHIVVSSVSEQKKSKNKVAYGVRQRRKLILRPNKAGFEVDKHLNTFYLKKRRFASTLPNQFLINNKEASWSKGNKEGIKRLKKEKRNYDWITLMSQRGNHDFKLFKDENEVLTKLEHFDDKIQRSNKDNDCDTSNEQIERASIKVCKELVESLYIKTGDEEVKRLYDDAVQLIRTQKELEILKSGARLI